MIIKTGNSDTIFTLQAENELLKARITASDDILQLEIQRLEAENERLRKSLADCYISISKAIDAARLSSEALEELIE